MSDYSQAEVARLVGLQASLICTGTAATLMTSAWKWPLMIYTLISFAIVQIGIWRMINTAREACSDGEQRRRLQFLRNITPHVWNTFPAMWFCQYFGILSVFQAECGNMLGNFVAKALLSSSIMFSNFMSIHQRRAEAKEKAEQSNRLKLIEDLQESMRVKEEFLSMVSHELRTPLNGIIGLSEAMLRPGSWSLGEKGTHYIKTIKNSSNHLATLINDILDAAAMAKGKLVIKQETVDLKKVVEHVCDTAGHLLKPNVTLEKMVDQSTPLIAGDGSRIVQILYNLVGNSAKFTTEGSITVMLKPMPCSDPSKEFVQLSVRDTGCGISKEKQRDMFVPFGQGDMTATRKFGGTGLGLSITKKLIEAHNGIIAVESTLGMGSTFVVQLPVQLGGKVDPSTLPPLIANSGLSVTFGNDAEVLQSRRPSKPGQLQTRRDGPSREFSRENAMKAAPAEQAGATTLHRAASTKVVLPGLNVTSIPLNSDVPPSPVGSLLPAVSYKLIKLDQTEGVEGADPTPKFMLAGADANEPLLPPTQSKHLRNRKIKTRMDDRSGDTGTPCSLKDLPCLTDRKQTNNEEYGTTLILSVDDEPVNHMVIEECLSNTGYKLHCMTLGTEALKWVADGKVLPDLILLDCMMPGMSGHEFCTELRKTVPDAVVPVIMVSAKNDEANIVEGLSHGCNDFVGKPVKRGELLARIKAHLRVKSDATWVQSIVKGVLTEDSEAMKILESILPQSIISRIQDGHQVIGDSHEHVVILFSDIVGFSTMAATMSAIEVFLMLSNLYYAFDRLVDKFGIYKVETIGDGYMLAAGKPPPFSSHPSLPPIRPSPQAPGHDEDDEKAKIGTPLERVLLMADAMLDAIKTFKSPDGKALCIRIGVHCGGAYAGVIGMKCPRYCFLGDTVNTASRMESNSFPMCIHVSEAVVDTSSQKDQFVCLGERSIKGKGIMVTSLYKVGTPLLCCVGLVGGGAGV
ncbi:Hexokinase-3 [Trebouxia sp. C0009 RCD-2024]